LTLYVESNFILEIALGQEELVPAERLLAAAEAGTVDIALPSFSLSESVTRITRGIRDRGRLTGQFRSHVGQLARSASHQTEVATLLIVPNLIEQIDEREEDRLMATVERVLTIARLIELDTESFQAARDFQVRFAFTLEDAIVFAGVIADLTRSRRPGLHVFANRNRKDFGDPGIAAELRRLGCDLVLSFEEAARQLGIR
jgi:hypothetical protein